MSLKCGIVGLPNVGKSTLFNAFTNTALAQVANYPFCTIEPNVGCVAVPDERLDKLGNLVNTQKLVYNQLEVVDIAGLVAGASKGEGLGNQFLANIRECDVIIHVIRCFSNDEIVHVDGNSDPVSDVQTIETELQLADISTLEKIINNNEKKAKSGNKDAVLQLKIAKKIVDAINSNKMIVEVLDDEVEQKIAKQFCLLTMKNVIYVANVGETDDLKDDKKLKALTDFLSQRGAKPITICASVEAEISTFSKEEKIEYLKSINCSESGLDKIVKAGYAALGLITFFTVGPKETRAWPIKLGMTAPEAAGVIHTDFQRGFIKAETISYDDFIKYKSEEAVKEAGKMRTEGKDYVVKDGDIFHFKFNV